MSRDFIFLPQPKLVEWLPGQQARAGLPVEVRQEAVHGAESYRIDIRPDGIVIIASDAAGEFYARKTIDQLERQCLGGPLPCGTIVDWPDFPTRGVMLDISRDKVPTMATLFMLVDEFASWKINHFQLYLEHTFAYQDHEIVWAEASPITSDELQQLEAYCRERFIDFVPNQNSFGHMERWLKHEPYHQVAECPDGAFYFDAHRPPATLDPLDRRSITLVRSLHDELLANFRHGTLFNVGCDETMELGMGKSKPECDRVGRERVYLDFLRQIHESVSKHNRTMMFWGDIILHRPELIPELPRPIIALDWGYEADHPFEVECAAFEAAGVPHYVCPGTSSWCSLAGRTTNMIGCIRSAAVNGLRHGAIGLLNTDWGDHGHWQYLPISYAGFAMGAAAGWNVASTETIDLAACLDVHVFRDRSRTIGRLAMSLGDVYRLEPAPRKNGSVLFWLLQASSDLNRQISTLSVEDVAQIRRAIVEAIQSIDQSRMTRPDAALIRGEFKNTAAMMFHACDRAEALLRDPTATDTGSAARQHFIAEHHRLWLARNRVGGLADSVARFA